jgi:hypothetical protein
VRHCSGGSSVRWRPASHGGSRTSAWRWSVVVEPSWFAIWCFALCSFAGPWPGLRFSAVRALALVRLAGVSSGVARGAGSAPRPCASAPPALLARRGRCQPSARACALLQAPRVASGSGSSLVCGLRQAVCATRSVAWQTGAHGSQAGPAPSTAPNPSIERTSSSVLRTLPAAAHVQR